MSTGSGWPKLSDPVSHVPDVQGGVKVPGQVHLCWKSRHVYLLVSKGVQGSRGGL